MGKRRFAMKGQWLERVAFLGLLALIAALAVASTRLGDDDEGTAAPTPVRPPDVLRSGPLTALIGESAVVPATSVAGRRRDRVRVIVVAELRSAAGEELSARRALRLEYSGRRILPDPNANDNGALDVGTPIPPRGTRRGELRFELAGTDTRVLRNRGDARLVLVAPNGRRDGVRLPFDVPAS